MALDTKKWLIEEMGFSEDEATALLPQFQTRAEKLEKGYLRQSDYSRQMNDLRKAETDLKTANDRLTEDMAEWASMTAAEKAQAGDLKAALDESRLEVTRLTQKVTRLAEDGGIDPKTVLGDKTPVTPAEPKPVTFDPTSLQQQIGGVADYMLTLNAELPGIAEEHFRLTGERLDTRAFIAGIKEDIRKNKTDNLDPVKRWETAYQIPEKRVAKSAEQRTTELAQAREEGRLAAMSEAALPNTRPLGQSAGSSTVFKTVGSTPKLQRPNTINRHAGAVAAITSGKYRTAGPAST